MPSHNDFKQTLMDSINRNQPEDNQEDLRGREAIKRIREMVEKAETCFFCTAVSHGSSGATRPMSVQKVDDGGRLWFLSASDSHKNSELAAEPSVRLFFQISENSGFLTLTGQARISRDKKKIKELWNPILRTWFTEGADDPRISVIEVAPTGGYYWDNKHGNALAGIKMLIGAAIGKTMDDSIEGALGVAARSQSAPSPAGASDRSRSRSMPTLHAFGLIFDSQSRILLCRRSKDNKWNLPGGELDENETPWEAVVRELREETSLTVEAKRLAGIYSVPKESDLVFTFLCSVTAGSPTAGDAVSEVGWFPLTEMPRDMREFHAERAKDAAPHDPIFRTNK